MDQKLIFASAGKLAGKYPINLSNWYLVENIIFNSRDERL